MSFKLRSEIIFTKLINGEKNVFKAGGGINDLKITRSVLGSRDTAMLKMPAIGIVLNNDNLPSKSVESADFFSHGDQIEIRLGYNGDFKTEFKGFITKVFMSVPVLIECEGYSFQLRKSLVKSWKETTVVEVLEFLTGGTDIKVSSWSKMQTIKLRNFSIRNVSGWSVLEEFRKKMGLTTCFLFDELYVGLQQAPKMNDVKVRLGWNVIRDNKLESIENRKILVRVRYREKFNKKVVEIGDRDGQLVELNIPYVEDLKTVLSIAENKFERAKSLQIKDAITCFLQPYIQPFDILSITDKRYQRRDGKYFVTETEVTFGMNGARRKIELGTKLN